MTGYGVCRGCWGTDFYVIHGPILNYFCPGSHEEKEGSQHGLQQVRGEVQVWQEQGVLPEAEVLHLSNYLYCRVLFLLFTKQVSWQPVFELKYS